MKNQDVGLILVLCLDLGLRPSLFPVLGVVLGLGVILCLGLGLCFSLYLGLGLDFCILGGLTKNENFFIFCFPKRVLWCIL